MAVIETSSIRALIDKNVEYDRERRLSPGMAVKAMIGPIFDGRKKLPLSGVRYFYNVAPADILFGKGVDKVSLNDNALARNLDDIFDTGLDELFWKCSRLIIFVEVMAMHKDSAYIVKETSARIETPERRPTRGRSAADSPPPGTITEWRIDIDAVFDESLAAELAKRRDISVIITDLPFAAEDAGDLRDGATANKVLRLYLDQYKVEHTYRLMKSGMGVDIVYVQTPSRVNALLFVIGIATLVSSIMDAVLRKNGCRYGTVKQACRDLQYMMLEYRRDEEAVSFIGCEGSGEKAFDYLDGIGLDPSTILDICG